MERTHRHYISKTSGWTLLLFAFTAASGVSPAVAAQFECPSPGAVATTPLSAEIDKLLPKGEAVGQPDQLQAAAALLKEHGVKPADAINQLIARYCAGVAADAGLDDAQKAEHVRKFAETAANVVLPESNVDAILFDVPLPPVVANQVLEQARNAGLSAEEWIARTATDSVTAKGATAPASAN